ncbi:hypothetical protein RFI_15756, partial [Reticulomyxa filosa]
KTVAMQELDNHELSCPSRKALCKYCEKMYLHSEGHNCKVENSRQKPNHNHNRSNNHNQQHSYYPQQRSQYDQQSSHYDNHNRNNNNNNNHNYNNNYQKKHKLRPNPKASEKVWIQRDDHRNSLRVCPHCDNQVQFSDLDAHGMTCAMLQATKHSELRQKQIPMVLLEQPSVQMQKPEYMKKEPIHYANFSNPSFSSSASSSVQIQQNQSEEKLDRTVYFFLCMFLLAFVNY